MNKEEWIKEFKPIMENDEPKMFETYGKDIEYVKKQNPNCIWTDIYADEFNQISSGFHIVNRMGYYITEIPCMDREIVPLNYSIDEHGNLVLDDEGEDDDESDLGDNKNNEILPGNEYNTEIITSKRGSGKSEAHKDIYYRLTNPDKEACYLSRNEEKDPNWCKVLDENGNYHGDNWNWMIIKGWTENGTAVETSYQEIKAEIYKRKAGNENNK